MAQVLSGQILRPADFKPVEESLLRFFADSVFQPLAAIWKEETGFKMDYENSVESDRRALLSALRSGRLQLTREKDAAIFSGERSATIGRALRNLGAKFDERSGIYRIKADNVPDELVKAGADHTAAIARAHRRMDEFLAGVRQRLGAEVDKLSPEALGSDRATKRVESGFQDATRRVSIAFDKPNAETRARMSANYTNNLKLWIKKWAAEDIIRLRHEVEANSRTGARAASLIDRISARYGVAQSKARFLARQETGLFMAQYHREKFVGAGVPRYVWSTSHDCDVRKVPNGGHKALEGRIFSWHEGAPAEFMSSKKRCNPHEDFNCRCVAKPLLDTIYNAKFKIGDRYRAQS